MNDVVAFVTTLYVAIQKQKHKKNYRRFVKRNS